MARSSSAGLQRAVGWQFHFFAGQVQAFAYSTLRAFRLLTDRVVALERRLPITDPRVEAMLTIDRDQLDLGPWLDQVPQWFAGRSGRVLHAESGTGALVVALNKAGIDAYGVDPRDDAGAVADAAGAETRTTGALDHLRALPPGALGGLVLSGCVDRFALGDQLELANHGAARARARRPVGGPRVASTALGAAGRSRDRRPHVRPAAAPADVDARARRSRIRRGRAARRCAPDFEARANLSPEVVAVLAEIEPLLFPPEAFAVIAERPAEPDQLDCSA